jgi:hypothetical protein
MEETVTNKLYEILYQIGARYETDPTPVQEVLRLCLHAGGGLRAVLRALGNTVGGQAGHLAELGEDDEDLERAATLKKLSVAIHRAVDAALALPKEDLPDKDLDLALVEYLTGLTGVTGDLQSPRPTGITGDLQSPREVLASALDSLALGQGGFGAVLQVLRGLALEMAQDAEKLARALAEASRLASSLPNSY